MFYDPWLASSEAPRPSVDLPLSSLEAPSGAKPELPSKLLVGIVLSIA